jgi:Protein of unknown function (DUF2997)
MHKQDIEIVISPKGEVTFTIKGVKGPNCLAETKFLEEALGGVVTEQVKTGEYYEQSEGYVSTWASGGDGEGTGE